MSKSGTIGEETYRFDELIDVSAFARMMERFFLATGIPNGLVDTAGELLAMAGGDNACTRFHRVNPGTVDRCKDSNLELMRDLEEGHVACSLCANGLMDYATPVVIEGKQMATLFMGQVLHTPPDTDFFREQAVQFNFDQTEYLKSIAAIPVVEKTVVQSLMAVMVDVAGMLAESGLSKLRQEKLESDLSAHADRRIQLEDILDFSPIAISWADAEGRFEHINRQFMHLFGYALEELPNLDAWYRLAYPDEQYRDSVVYPWVRDANLASQTGTPPPELECDVICKDGSVRRVVVRVAQVGSRQLFGFSDITERWLSEQRKQAHDALLEMVACGVRLTDILTAIVMQSESEVPSTRCTILLLDEERKHLSIGAAPGMSETFNQSVHGIAVGEGIGSCGTAAYTGNRVIVEDVSTHEYWQPFAEQARAEGIGACWSEPILSSEGEVLGTFAIYHAKPTSPQPTDLERITIAANLAAIAIENRQAHEELKRLAYTDYLTGLANRRAFIERAEEILFQMQRTSGELAVLLLDLDHFKLINDMYGHEVGDLVLKRFAQICHKTLRKVDLVGRLGGEEFAILLPETDFVQAVDVAERLRTAIAEAVLLLEDGKEICFTASLGVALFDKSSSKVDILLNRADYALYQAKQDGRNRVSVFRPSVKKYHDDADNQIS